MKKSNKSKTKKAKASKKKTSKAKASKKKPAAKAKKAAKKKPAAKKVVAKKAKAVKKVVAKKAKPASKPAPRKAAKEPRVVTASLFVAEEISHDMPVIPIPRSEMSEHSEEESVHMEDDFKGFEEPGPVDTDDDEDDF